MLYPAKSPYRSSLFRPFFHRARRVRLSLLLPLTAAIFGAGFLGVTAPLSAQLSAERQLRLYQSDLGGTEASGDLFGAALAAGHFNNDAFLDLAIGVPQKSVGGDADAGVVYITYGSFIGLGLGPSSSFFQDRSDLEDSSDAGDLFGSSLAVGDFDGDGFDDLAVGIPGEQIGVSTEAGAIHILYGSSVGIVPDDDQFFHQNSTGIADIVETGDRYGFALATGNFDNDAHDDLAIGIPGEDVGFTLDAGAVSVIFGSVTGLAPEGNLFLSTDEEAGDELGTSLATADRSGDGRDDLIVGVPGEESTGGNANAGQVLIYISGGDTLINLSGFGTSTGDSRLGTSVATGDLDDDGIPDAFGGAPERGDEATGRVLIFDESDGGIDSLFQGLGGLYEEAEPFDRFGTTLASGDFDADGHADMVIGVPFENLFEGTPEFRVDSGLVHIVRGGDDGLDPINNQVWHLGLPVLGTAPVDNGNFGAALVTGDFDGDGHDDLVIGAPRETGLSVNQAGLVQILYSQPALFLDNFESGDTAAWGTVVGR